FIAAVRNRIDSVQSNPVPYGGDKGKSCRSSASGCASLQKQLSRAYGTIVEMFWTLDLKSCCWDQPRIDPKNGALDVRQKKYTLTRASVPDSDGIRAPAKKKKEAPFSWPHLPLSWHPGYRKSHVAQIVRTTGGAAMKRRSEEHTSELQSLAY